MPSSAAVSATAQSANIAAAGNLTLPTSPSMRPVLDRQLAVALYVAAMVAVIVGVEVGFFRNRFWERLAVNIGIVLVFGAFYLRFLMPP